MQILTGRLLTFLLMRKMIAKFKCQFPFRRKRFTEHDSSPAELLLVPFGINSIRLRHQKYLQNEHSFQTNWLMLRDHTREKLKGESNALSETKAEKPKYSILHNSASGWRQGQLLSLKQTAQWTQRGFQECHHAKTALGTNCISQLFFREYRTTWQAYRHVLPSF